MLNRVELIGYLQQPPELQYTAHGAAYCLLTLDTTRYSGGRQYTDRHSVMTWHATAERCAKYLHVGESLYIDGRLEAPDSDAQIVAQRVLFLGRRQPSQSQPRQRTNGPVNRAPIERLSEIVHAAQDEDEPFTVDPDEPA